MAKATHKLPAQIRYEQSHPTVTCRLDKDTHDLLKQRLEDLGGASFADFVKESLGLLQLRMPDIELKPTCYCCTDQDKLVIHPDLFIICKECYRDFPDADINALMEGYFREV